MNKPIYSKSQGISSEDVAVCDNPFQLKKWAIAIQRDCISIKDGVDFTKDVPEQKEVHLKRKAALRSQVQLLREIIMRYNEVKAGIPHNINGIMAFYQAAQKILPVEAIDIINELAMQEMKLLPM